jgi:hypothetical protein
LTSRIRDLAKIQQQIDALIEQLRGAFDKRDRLRADLFELNAHPAPPVDLEPTAIIIPFPDRREPAHPPVVSPKIARVMRAPRRPGLERTGSGLMGHSAGSSGGF